MPVTIPDKTLDQVVVVECIGRAAFDRGTLAIGASSNIEVYLLQPLVRAFTSAQSSVCPIDIGIGTNPETARRLEDAEVDIALMEWWDDRPGFEAAGLAAREKLVVTVPPDQNRLRLVQRRSAPAYLTTFYAADVIDGSSVFDSSTNIGGARGACNRSK